MAKNELKKSTKQTNIKFKPIRQTIQKKKKKKKCPPKKLAANKMGHPLGPNWM